MSVTRGTGATRTPLPCIQVAVHTTHERDVQGRAQSPEAQAAGPLKALKPESSRGLCRLPGSTQA
jgi:hypothetical protein